MKVDSLHLAQFSVFEDVELSFSPGINVFLGTNGTGKSHAMKALYAPLKVMQQKAADGSADFGAYFEKLGYVFKPDRRDMRRLRRRGVDGKVTKIAFSADGLPNEITIAPILHVAPTRRSDAKAIFLPPRELLSMFDGFLAAYTGRELSFDETYYDACLALSASLLRGPRFEETVPLRAPIEALIGGPVVLEGNRFFVRRQDGDMEINLLAEGWRKLASIAHLIANGSLSPGTAFFWDEPEAGLNPQTVVLVVDILLELAERGLQIFVATHDYLLSRRLSLFAEYGKRPAAAIRFHGFQRAASDGPVTVTSGDTLADLPQDSISAEFLRQYDLEREMFDEEGTG